MTVGTKLRWYMHRVRAMSAAEVGHRFAEKYRHATPTQYLRKITAAPWDEQTTAFPRLPDPTAAPVELRSKLAADAGLLQRGAWELFGWQTAEVGAPPSWHRDPVSEVALDSAVLSHRLDHRHLPAGGDARCIWEINRWAEITRLAMHGWLNADNSAILAGQKFLENWCATNRTGYGINWTSPLEAALRLLNFTWFDALVRAAAIRMEDQREAILERQARLTRLIVPTHAAWIWRHRSFGSSANNHLLGELAALAVAAARWPGIEKVACSADIAWTSLSGEILRQFAGDGGNREQALHYHLFAWDMAWQAAQAVGCDSGEVYERLTDAARFFADMAPEAEAWDFGDSDDAQVLPFTLDRTNSAAEWKHWLLGHPGSLSFWFGASPLGDENKSPLLWRLYPETGMAVCDHDSWKVRLDASPLGLGPLAAHGHCDALHVSVWDGAEALIIDPGTGRYFADSKLRTRLAAWDAHNGPLPRQGFVTPERIGAFLQNHPHSIPSLESKADSVTARFAHENHTFRRTVRVSPGKIEISDHEAAGRPLSSLWQFAPECAVQQPSIDTPNQLLISRGSRQWLLRIEAEAAVVLEVTAKDVSRAYGKLESAPAVSIQSSTPMRLTIERR